MNLSYTEERFKKKNFFLKRTEPFDPIQRRFLGLARDNNENFCWNVHLKRYCHGKKDREGAREEKKIT
jgi:hypothetical protein